MIGKKLRKNDAFRRTSKLSQELRYKMLKCGQNSKDRIRRFYTQMQPRSIILIVFKETQLGQVAPGIELRPYDKESL